MAVTEEKCRAEGQIVELRRQLASVQVGLSGVSGSSALPSSFAQVAGGSSAAVAPRDLPDRVADGTSADGAPRGQEHALQLRLVSHSASPGHDIAPLLKTTFNPSEIGVGPVVFRPTRVGLTVLSSVRTDLENLERAITATPVTRNAFEVRRPVRRLPQIKISGVDPSIVPAMLLDQINSRNNLDIAAADFTHRTQYTERSGNRTHIVEVSPRVFSQLLQKGKLHIGWTSCHLRKNLYVPTCFNCSTLGHANVRCTEQQSVCGNCAGRHATNACAMDDNTRFVCYECKKWGRPHDHFFAAAACHSVKAWVERLRKRTDYDYPSSNVASPLP